MLSRSRRSAYEQIEKKGLIRIDVFKFRTFLWEGKNDMDCDCTFYLGSKKKFCMEETVASVLNIIVKNNTMC